ncbi:MAG TPA: hypothetical protein VMR73_01810 [Candidatus Paceibacterota bacterium]|nr:hypothetical protein [Candidatus Paceibacterota bacterium]
MLQQVLEKIKFLVAYLTRKDIYTCLVIVLVGMTSFFIGGLWGREENRPPVTIKMVDMNQNASVAVSSGNIQNPTSVSSTTEPYVGNVNSKIYQLSSCLGAKLISDENKIWFASKANAEAAGYVPAKNCKM